MSETVYQNLKSKLEQLYQRNFAVEVGFYDNNDNLQKEMLIPLGNYIYDPMPSMSEQEITESLCSRSLK
tara:strand:+ start:472 stop:678 length:207 start_codon:yes stop_codon:yes gene_type:complete